MKKFLIATLATTAVTTAAQAGSMSFDFRGDYLSTTYKDSPGKTDSTKFYLKTGRIDYQGKANDDLTYRVRLAFTKKSDALSDTDAVVPSVEFASITQKMSDTFSLTAGKFNTEIGGFEGITSSADLYMTSTFYTATGNSSNLLGGKDLLYLAGVKGTFTMDTNTVSLMVMNEPDTKAGPTASQNSSTWGLSYKGAFMDKTLNVMASYYTFAGNTKDDKNSYSALGVQWNSSPIVASLDYLMSESKVDATGFKDSVNSIVANLAYTGMEKWTPRVEVISSEETIGGTTDLKNKYMSYGVIAEYKPYADQNFRYHVAYVNTKSDIDGVDADAIKDEVVVGARLLADFLK